MYRIHPALPAYLSTKWRDEQPVGHDHTRDAATRALVTACATFSRWLLQQIRFDDAGLAYAIIALQHLTLGSMLSYALAHRLWEDAQMIVEPLELYWDAQGSEAEADAWADQILLATENADGTPPEIESPAGALWLFIAGAQAHRQARLFRLDEAERAHRQIQARLEALDPSPQQRRNLAITYHHLGVVGELRGLLDAAEIWHRKSLALHQELDNKPGTAGSYHQLGVVAEQRGRLDDAENYYRKSLALDQELGDKANIANTYHQLGLVALERGHLDDAEDRHRNAQTIFDELGDKLGIASSLGQLGIAAQKRGRLGVAEDHYRKVLAILDELGDKPGLATTYHALGVVAQKRGQLAAAENWYQKSLAIGEQLGYKPAMASSFGQLGLLADARGETGPALEWTIKCIALFEEFPHPSTGPGPEHLARLTAQVGFDALEECWREVTGEPLPQAVREYVEAHGR
jgi:tetratricopeptide (TPR) repeat protein